MKINFYELFDMINEEAVDILLSTDKNRYENEINYFSSLNTINAVIDNIDTPIFVKKKRKQLPFILIAILIVTLSASVLAGNENNFLSKIRASLINNSNRHLIGKSEFEENPIVTKDENFTPSKEEKDIFSNSSIIKSVAPDTLLPSSVSYFQVTQKDDSEYLIPELIFTNGTMIVLTQSNGDGWYLKKGEQLGIHIDLYPSESTNKTGQTMEFRYICNGELTKNSYVADNVLSTNYEITAERDGLYYLCIHHVSSDSITIKSGQLYLK